MRGHVQQLIEGEKYRVYVHAGRHPLTGKRRYVTETVNGTRKQAHARLSALLVRVNEGDVGAVPVKFGDLLDRWLVHVEARREAWTVRGYRSKVEAHIRPALGDLLLRRLTAERLDRFYDELLVGGGKRPGRTTLSAQTVAHIHAVVRRALNYGVRNEWLDKNPALNAEPPPVEMREQTLPTPAELVAVLAELTVDMREFAALAVVIGARRGELCGLRWSDLTIDETDDGGLGAQLMISRAIADPPEGIIVKTTKTRQVRRQALDADTFAMLTARRAREAERALACGTPYPPDAYIFADLPGGTEPLRPALATKRWANAAARAGAKARLHDLRHFHVTELLDAGFEIGDVSKGVGHARTSITQDGYQHARRSKGRAAAEHLSKLVQGG